MNRTLAVPALASLALGAAVALPGPASAHVTVNPSTATGGSYSKLTFRVPTESDTASTTRVAVYFPTNPAFASVSVKPHPGWAFKVTKDGDDVRRVTWTPDSPANAIKPGEFDEFDISLGPLPATGTVVFKALQSYSDGSVVRWIEQPSAGQDEPEHPAPVLTLTPAVDATPAPTATAAPQAGDNSSDSDGSGDSRTPLVLSITALVVAAGALALSAVRRPRS